MNIDLTPVKEDLIFLLENTNDKSMTQVVLNAVRERRKVVWKRCRESYKNTEMDEEEKEFANSALEIYE